MPVEPDAGELGSETLEVANQEELTDRDEESRTHMSTHMSVRMPIRTSMHMSMRMSVHMSMHMSMPMQHMSIDRGEDRAVRPDDSLRSWTNVVTTVAPEVRAPLCAGSAWSQHY